MGSLPRGNIHVLVNAAKLSSGTTVNLMKQIKKYFKILYSLRDVNIKFIFMSYFGKKGQSDAMKIMSQVNHLPASYSIFPYFENT